jgi:hypothetical protein
MFPAFPVQRAINSGIPYSIIGQTQSHILLLNVAHISHLVGGLDHFLFFHTLGMSSAQLTFFFQRGSNHQPAIMYPLHSKHLPHNAWCHPIFEDIPKVRQAGAKKMEDWPQLAGNWLFWDNVTDYE